MPEKLIINFSNDPAYITSFLKENYDDWGGSILDFTGSVSVKKGKYEVINADSIDIHHHIKSYVLQNYVKEIGNLSLCKLGNINIRSIQVLGLPLFWLTQTSVKDAYFHWGQNYFFFEALMKKKGSAILKNKTELLVILPLKSSSKLKPLIVSNLLKYNHKLNISFNLSTKKRRNTFILFIYSLYILTRMYIRTSLASLKKRKYTFSNNYKLIVGITTTNFHLFKSRFISGHLHSYMLEKNKNPSIIPIFPSTYLNISSEISHEFIPFFKKKPTIRSLLPLYWDLIQCFYTLIRVKKDKKDLLTNLITEELINILFNVEYYFNILWLSRIFKEINENSKVFYEDEFRKSGRVISYAKIHSNNNNITTHGLQHGLFFDNHTVYTIGDKELISSRIGLNDALPTPDYFIVWGRFFKNMMSQYNSSYMEKIICAGNIRFINQKSLSNNIKSTTTTINYLWCTTIPRYTHFELEIINRFFEKKQNFLLTIRMHPLWDIKDYLLENFKLNNKNNILFENDIDLRQQIESNHIIFSSSYSTIFYDCILLKRPVLRFTPAYAYPIFKDLNIPYLYNVNKLEDMENSIHQILNFKEGKNHEKDISIQLNYNKPDIWDELIQETP